MKSAALFLALGSIIPALAAGVPSSKPGNGSPRVVGLTLERHRPSNPVTNDAKRLRRRAGGTVNATVDNEEILYFLNATLGTPPQPVRVHLDTGSSDLWVNTPSSQLCTLRTKPCAASGTYNANSSSTYGYVGSYFNISYVDGSGASGDYVTDTFRLFGQDIKDLQFGVGYVSTSPQAVLGVGYPSNEASVARQRRSRYENLPAKMVAEGIIASSAYSLWLNDINAEDGSILFGGVDQSRYEGDLVTVPIQKPDSQFTEFYITMTGLEVGQTKVASNKALAVLLDSGSSFTYLPEAMTQEIYKTLNARFQQRDGVAYVPCSLRNEDRNLTFRFSDPAVVNVPVREIIIDPTDLSPGRPVAFSDGTPACYCGILPADSGGTSVLGDTFLRSAYVVYDLDNNQISLANTKFNATQSDIQEIGTGNDAVPQAKAAPNPVSATTGFPNGSSRNSDSGAAGVRAPELLSVALALALSVMVASTLA